jgi:RNA methyltransferase, TrmH family
MTSSEPIDSLANTHVAAARSLLTRKGRVAASAFLVEGPHAVGEAIEAAEHHLREVFVTELAADRDPALVGLVREAGVTVRVVTERVLASLRDTVTPQGVVAVADIPPASLTDVFGRPESSLAVALEQIGDPGNAGAVIRTADAAGAAGVVATDGSVDVWSGKCVRASAGSVFHLPLVTAVASVDLLAAAQAAGFVVLVTAADGADGLDELIDARALAAPTVWVFGNEAHGVSEPVRAAADRVVRLPIYGRAESLNLAAAAAICLYASARALRHR